jgi:hypothetical protein
MRFQHGADVARAVTSTVAPQAIAISSFRSAPRLPFLAMAHLWKSPSGCDLTVNDSS